MDAHITRFNQLLQEIEYNKPITIPSLQPESVNLQFMLSIGEGWETFSLAKGDWIRQVSTAELHSEIRAMDARKPHCNLPFHQPLILQKHLHSTMTVDSMNKEDIVVIITIGMMTMITKAMDHVVVQTTLLETMKAEKEKETRTMTLTNGAFDALSLDMTFITVVPLLVKRRRKWAKVIVMKVVYWICIHDK